jgi:hypothetical protein
MKENESPSEGDFHFLHAGVVTTQRGVDMLSLADDAGREPRLATFVVQLHRALMHTRLPSHAPRPLRIVDIKHWVRRRWPLPPEAVWAMSTWASEYVADEGWELQPHGVELVVVRGLRDPSVALARPLPDLLRTEYADGRTVTILALYTTRDRGAHARLEDALFTDALFTSEADLLAWLGAPRACADLWSLAHLERVEPDEASRLWLEDLQREVC